MVRMLNRAGALGGTCVAIMLLATTLLLSGCAGQDQQGNQRQRMRAWVQGAGVGSDIGTLVADAKRVSDVVALNRGTGAIHTACGVFTVDAESANSNLPSPDGQVTQLLAKAYALEAQAAQDCYNAGASNRALLAKSAKESKQAAALFGQALTRMSLIVGGPLSTTTTTQPDTGGIFG
jgi:hypothetical protein